MTVDPEKKPQSVLIVDDQPGIRLTLKGILTKKGYDVSVAADGTEALNMARQTPFRVIFMDIKMPGLSGVDTFVQMKEINPKATVIMMTGFALEDDIKRAIQEGAYAIVYKPFDMEKVLSIVGECLNERPLVLVVDDHEHDRRLLKEILTQKGYAVAEADSGPECLRRLEEKRFQIILLDVRMPEMDGVETLKEIRKRHSEAAVILISGYTAEDFLTDSLKRESMAVLRKPIEIEKLLDIMDQALKRGGKA